MSIYGYSKKRIIKKLKQQKLDLDNQVKTISDKKDYPSGEVLVKVDAKKSGKFEFRLSYLVKNASWFPSYDIRATDINSPVRLTYKANVKQDTKEDWNNVKLRFSSSKPNTSGVAPQLKTYFIDYNRVPPSYKLTSDFICGKVFDSSGKAMPGVNIVVEGTTIGVVSDIEGNYSITIPNSSSRLTYSFIGCKTKTLPITDNIMNVSLEEDALELQEVVVVGYGFSKRATKSLQGQVAGVSTNKTYTRKKKEARSLPVPTTKIQNQTTVNFEIATPYTIKSDNKSYSVVIANHLLPAFYQHYCVPKVDTDAFLMAHITNWQKYNLLEGESNVFFKDTYIGKTLMDVRYASDTLKLSLGRDKNISVQRERIKDFTEKQFIGNKKQEFVEWKTTIKNNKNEPVKLLVVDQIPVSTRQEIEIKTYNISQAKHDSETGKLKWKLDLKPSQTKELKLKYSVKYPKYRKLILE